MLSISVHGEKKKNIEAVYDPNIFHDWVLEENSSGECNRNFETISRLTVLKLNVVQ